MSTLLQRWDRTDHKETINRDDIRRALAIAQLDIVKSTGRLRVEFRGLRIEIVYLLLDIGIESDNTSKHMPRIVRLL